MKTITRSNIFSPMTAVILTAALAVLEAAQQVPFKGTLQGQDVDSACSTSQQQAGCVVVVTTTGTGIGTHLGQFSFTQVNAVNANGTDSGTAHLIAANGDSIYTTFVGSGKPIEPNLFSITEAFTITGGTGRFAGAQGGFTLERLASGVTFMTSGSFVGTITSPGADH